MSIFERGIRNWKVPRSNSSVWMATVFTRENQPRYQMESAIRVSPTVSPTRPRQPFFIRMALFGSAAPPVSRFRPDLGFHHSGEPRPSPAFRGALGDSGHETSSGPAVSATERVVPHHLFHFPPKCAAYTHFPRQIPPQL
jgi:hypothetical protein